MPFQGLPRKKTTPPKTGRGRKNPRSYLQRRREHEKQRTQPSFKKTTNIQAASVRGKITRFCEEHSIGDVDTFLKQLTVGDVKIWFDWIQDNFAGSIEAHGSLGTYWRTLKRLFYLANGKEMEESMVTECLNYYNLISKRMGLRRHALRKPTTDSNDLLKFQVAHLVHCESVFPDEKQRLYVTVTLNLSSVVGCRLVSLFDTDCPVNPLPDGTLPADSGDDASSDPGYVTRDGLTEPEQALDGGYASDRSTVTDDGYLGGKAVEIEAVLWRHVEFYILRNPNPGRRHSLVAIVTIIWTKGKFRVKRFVIEHEDNLIFDLLSQLLALGLDDKIFEADIKDEADIYTVPIPPHLKGIPLKIKKSKLDIPIFREPERTSEGYQTSDDIPLKGRTYGRSIKRTGKIAGTEASLTQKWVRRGVINAINEIAPSSVRDQVADHDSNAVIYYLNEIVSCDTAAAFHKRASNEEVQREMRSATLLADNTAPIRLTDEEARKIYDHPEVQKLRMVCKQLTDEIRRQGGTVKQTQADGTDLGVQKKEADAELARTVSGMREKALEKCRKRHFRDTPTKIFNQQYAKDSTGQQMNSQRRAPIQYIISEREEIVHLLFFSTPARTEDEIHDRRLKFIRLLVRWQKRKEAPRRGRQMVTTSPPAPPPEPPTSKDSRKYHPLQCPFCLSDPRLPSADRVKKKKKTNKLWDHVEKLHRQELAAFNSGTKICGLCAIKGEVYMPSNVPEFKRHTNDVHSIPLRL